MAFNTLQLGEFLATLIESEFLTVPPSRAQFFCVACGKILITIVFLPSWPC
jgi:hypothetical protein